MRARRGLAQGEQDPLVDGEADVPAEQVDEQELAEVQLKDLLFEAIGLAGAGQLETIRKTLRQRDAAYDQPMTSL